MNENGFFGDTFSGGFGEFRTMRKKGIQVYIKLILNFIMYISNLQDYLDFITSNRYGNFGNRNNLFIWNSENHGGYLYKWLNDMTL